MHTSICSLLSRIYRRRSAKYLKGVEGWLGLECIVGRKVAATDQVEMEAASGAALNV